MIPQKILTFVCFCLSIAPVVFLCTCSRNFIYESIRGKGKDFSFNENGSIVLFTMASKRGEYSLTTSVSFNWAVADDILSVSFKATLKAMNTTLTFYYRFM